MGLPEEKLAFIQFLQETFFKAEPDWDGLAGFIVKTRNQQKTQFLAWSTAKKTALTAQKTNLDAIKAVQSAFIDTEIANIVDVETNF